MEFKTGSLVRARSRNWIVLPSHDENLVLLKPLDGSEEEITGIYLPLGFEDDHIASTEFPAPTVEDIGDIASARLPRWKISAISHRPGSFTMPRGWLFEAARGRFAPWPNYPSGRVPIRWCP